MLEAICGKCGETFNPADEDDTEHGVTEDGTPCGGQGTITGEWVAPDLMIGGKVYEHKYSHEYPYGKGNQGLGTGPNGEQLI